MSTERIPLATLSPVYHRRDNRDARRQIGLAHRRLILWSSGMAIIAILYFGVPGFFAWKHVVASSGGRYFVNRVEIPVPSFEQNDPQWTFELLGPTFNTLGQQGCAVTSAAMVLAAYGVDTDPGRLNEYLTTHAGYTSNGWIYWEKAAEVAPGGQVEKAYEDLPSYALIDENLAHGNPVIVRLTLRNGTTHFVVVVGKQGWDYLIRDPARSPASAVYPLKNITDHIEALRFYRIVPPHVVSNLATSATTPALPHP
ncbi:MAG TPA: C39 family peptidase [Candidatus Methylacidiphilales bacterium]|nr:C39 family peptidase [Candidatus Methylacidiphilales bacterium]